MLTIIYANRNRDIERIKASFESLKRQANQQFKVVFVDFGSKKSLTHGLVQLCEKFSFVDLHLLPTSRVLWNKSKALNYGIKKATGDYIFIADTDLVFHPESTRLFDKIKNSEKFQLFTLGYLDKKESLKLQKEYEFIDLNPSRLGKVNGMILTSKESLLNVNGLDEFFHFYGAEDEDLFVRLEHAGYKREVNATPYFYHNWHKSFSGSEDKLLTGNPRVKNIMRINQCHFFRNRERNITKPLQQNGMGEIINPDLSVNLDNPDTIIKVPNILAWVEHLLREELPSYKNKIVRLEFFEDHYYSSLKHQLKKLLDKQTQPYISMKEVNDMILREILFKYRDHNYSFEIKENLKSIVFCVQV